MALQRSLNLAVIGNSNINALIDRNGCIVWSCFPRMDGDPIFCSLLRNRDDIGFWKIDLEGMDRTKSQQHYTGNAPIVKTSLYTSDDDGIEIVDFAPRHELFHRVYRPNTIVRMIKPISGQPKIRIRLHPTFAYGWGAPERTRGSNHIRYLLANQTVRLTTNLSISYILNEVLFTLEVPVYLILMPDESLTISPEEYFQDSIAKTEMYWEQWTSGLRLPLEYQDQVIRSSIVLKLNTYEETGGIISAMTTSIPQSESPDSARLDYRYSLFRDSSRVIRALNSLNATGVMQGYESFIKNLLVNFPDVNALQPVFGIGLENRLAEKPIHRLAGYRGFTPVKTGTPEAKIKNHGAFGSIILSFAQMFYDKRFRGSDLGRLFKMLEIVGEKCASFYKEEDDFELGSPVGLHTVSAVLCWAGTDRLSKISDSLGKSDRAAYWRIRSEEIRTAVLLNALSPDFNGFVSTYEPFEDDTHAQLLDIWAYGFLSYDDPRMLATVKHIEKHLRVGDGIKRTTRDKTLDFAATFTFIRYLCNFPDRKVEALRMFTKAINIAKKSDWCFSEKWNPDTMEMWGNYPYAPAAAAMIECALVISRDWSVVV